MRAGAILVCPFTDPGWTPLIGRAAAVVTEAGGLLSHAAVICREFGVPAVLGIRRATERIANGSQVTVDGGAGAVFLANAGVPAE
jgi:pyruvate,water dikinase